MKISKDSLLKSLPVEAEELTIRNWVRDDVDRRAGWPEYPAAYAAFNGTLRSLSSPGRDLYFSTRDSDGSQVTLAVDRLSAMTIAHVALKEIDWSQGTVGNMGIRLHPTWCDRGVDDHDDTSRPLAWQDGYTENFAGCCQK